MLGQKNKEGVDTGGLHAIDRKQASNNGRIGGGWVGGTRLLGPNRDRRTLPLQGATDPVAFGFDSPKQPMKAKVVCLCGLENVSLFI